MLLYSWILSYSLLHWKYEIKVSNVKRLAGKGLGETGHKLPVVHSLWSHVDNTYFSQ